MTGFPLLSLIKETTLPYGKPVGVSVLKVAVPEEATKVRDNSASLGKVDISPAIGGDESPLP